MASGQSWTAPESSAPATTSWDLRPLSTGEILDRTFQLYRSRFALFASLAALPAAVRFVTGGIQLLVLPRLYPAVPGSHGVVNPRPWLSAGVSIAFLFVYFVFYGITQAATTWAVAEIYLGKAASIRAAWRAALAHWVRYVLVTLRQWWSIGWWPMLSFVVLLVAVAVPSIMGTSSAIVGIVGFFFGLQLLVSCIYAVWAALKVSLAVPASVLESLGPNPAVRRSIALLPERKGRIFLLGLLIYAMTIVFSMVLFPIALIALRAHGAERYILQMLQLVVGFFSSLLIGPIAAIALCLFYFDERVRHEGFDIEFLMQRAAPPPNPNPVAEETPSPEPV